LGCWGEEKVAHPNKSSSGRTVVLLSSIGIATTLGDAFFAESQRHQCR
jgi:hypothetical protein